MSKETCGQDSGVVPEQGITGVKESREIRKRVMRERVGCAIYDEQTRLIATRSGFLRDKVWRERVVEKIGGEIGHEVLIAEVVRKSLGQRGRRLSRGRFEACAGGGGEFLPALSQSPT